MNGLDGERMGHKIFRVNFWCGGLSRSSVRGDFRLADSLSAVPRRRPGGRRQSIRVQLTYSDNPNSLCRNSSPRRYHRSFSNLKMESQGVRIFDLRVSNTAKAIRKGPRSGGPRGSNNRDLSALGKKNRKVFSGRFAPKRLFPEVGDTRQVPGQSPA